MSLYRWLLHDLDVDAPHLRDLLLAVPVAVLILVALWLLVVTAWAVSV